MKQKEAGAASATQERDTLRNKLKMLQDQILRGDQATARQATMQKVSTTNLVRFMLILHSFATLSTASGRAAAPTGWERRRYFARADVVCGLLRLQLRGSLDSQAPMWQNRVALAKELRASSAGARPVGAMCHKSWQLRQR